MRERPIGDLVDALRHQGCELRYLGNAGFPPLAIGASGGRAGGRIPIRGDVSSQFLSALLLALPAARGAAEVATTVEIVTPLISRPYVEITTRLMQRFGVAVATPDASTFRRRRRGRATSVPGPCTSKATPRRHRTSSPPASSAADRCASPAWAANSIQGDVAFADVLAAPGRRHPLRRRLDRSATGPPARRGHRRLPRDPRRGDDAGRSSRCSRARRCAWSTSAAGASRRPIASRRWRPSSRKLGARVAAGDDWLEVAPLASFRHAAIDTYDDHRMAMCFALAAFGGAGGDDQRSGLRAQDLSRLLRAVCQDCRRVRPETRSGDGARRAMSAESLPTVIADRRARRRRARAPSPLRVAQALGFRYLDSGSLYRLVALRALRHGTSPRTTRRDSRRSPRHSTPDLRRRAHRACRGATSAKHCAARTVSAAGIPRRRARPRSGRRSWHGSGRSGTRRGWSPTAATWARWSSRTPGSRCS